MGLEVDGPDALDPDTRVFRVDEEVHYHIVQFVLGPLLQERHSKAIVGGVDRGEAVMHLPRKLVEAVELADGHHHLRVWNMWNRVCEFLGIVRLVEFE